MRLYVWQDVLVDWTGGMITVIAPDKRAAIRMAKREIGQTAVNDMRSVTPTVVNLGEITSPPRIWYVWGGS